MALSKIDAANFLDGTLPDTNINNASLDNVTGLPAGVGGKVLQVVQDTLTSTFTTTSTSYSDTGLTVAITPSAASSKILILVDMGTCSVSANINDASGMKILRDATLVFEDAWFLYNSGSVALQSNIGSYHYLDSPSSTSALTYKVQIKCRTNSVSINVNSAKTAITLMEIGA